MSFVYRNGVLLKFTRISEAALRVTSIMASDGSRGNMLAKLAAENQTYWDEHLPTVT